MELIVQNFDDIEQKVTTHLEITWRCSFARLVRSMIKTAEMTRMLELEKDWLIYIYLSIPIKTIGDHNKGSRGLTIFIHSEFVVLILWSLVTVFFSSYKLFTFHFFLVYTLYPKFVLPFLLVFLIVFYFEWYFSDHPLLHEGTNKSNICIFLHFCIFLLVLDGYVFCVWKIRIYLWMFFHT